jgi:predicted DNA-binding transcriptional regulator AlpA
MLGARESQQHKQRNNDMANTDTIADQILQGAPAIAKFTGFTPRQIYHMAEKGEAPIRNVKGIGIVANKPALREFFGIPDSKTT